MQKPDFDQQIPGSLKLGVSSDAAVPPQELAVKGGSSGAGLQLLKENYLLSDGSSADSPGASTTPDVGERIQHLAYTQPYAVLCLQGGGQPYGALVAFAVSGDLRHVVFVTPVATRKFDLLTQSRYVALVIDNRSEMANELMEIEVVTVTGRSELIERGSGFTRWAELLTGRHPYLESFVNAETHALFRVEVTRCTHVARFQEVNQWVPFDRHCV